MEHDEARGLKLAKWTVEEPDADEVWAPADLHVEYASVDIFDTYSLQAYVPDGSSGVQQQLVEQCYYSAASEHNPVQIISVRADMISEAKKPPVPIHLAKQVSIDRHTNGVFTHVASEFDKADIQAMEKKMHRYPACLKTVDTCHTVPRFVAIGPYHHNRKALKPAEKVKHVAARYCITEGHTVEEVYEKVAEAADEARSLYDKNVMARVSEMDFRHMMFFDACFLVQFMLLRCGKRYKWIQESGGEDGDGSWTDFLQGSLSPKHYDILHDIMVLENQIPWTVVEAVLSFMPSSSSVSKDFVHKMRYLMLPDRQDFVGDEKHFKFDEDYTPPHILGLLRHHVVGRSKRNYPRKHDSKVKTISFSVSAIELAEIGITVTASKAMELTAMSLDMVGHLLCAELRLPSLSLDRDRASYLVNMAALELCTVKSFSRAKHASDSAVCSYLLLLAMLVHREEDVQELRVRGLLVGGGGLTNADALRFLSSFQGLRFGQHYNYIMETIDSYRAKRPTWLYAFFYNNWKTITLLIGGVSTVATIIGALASIKGSL
ncbi:unnamed protein product [Urochloa humidicola]